MNIYAFQCDTNNFRVLQSEEDLYTILDEFQQQRFGTNWTPKHVAISTDDLTMPDIFQITRSVPVLTRNAIEVLQPCLGDHLECLKIESRECDLYAINVYKEIDCLVKDQSKFREGRFGNIVQIQDGAFDGELLAGQGFFTIPNYSSVFMTEEPIRLMEKFGLTGVVKKIVGHTVN